MYFTAVGDEDSALASWKAAALAGSGEAAYIPEAIRLGKAEAAAKYLVNHANLQDASQVIKTQFWVGPGSKMDTVEVLPDLSGLAVILFVGDQSSISPTVVRMKSNERMYYRFWITTLQDPADTKQFLEGKLDAAKLIEKAGDSRRVLVGTHYYIGLNHYAHERFVEAMDSLSKVVQHGQTDNPIHYVARLLCERISKRLAEDSDEGSETECSNTNPSEMQH